MILKSYAMFVSHVFLVLFLQNFICVQCILILSATSSHLQLSPCLPRIPISNSRSPMILLLCASSARVCVRVLCACVPINLTGVDYMDVEVTTWACSVYLGDLSLKEADPPLDVVDSLLLLC